MASLRGALLLELLSFEQMSAVLADGLPDGVDAAPLACAHGDDGRLPGSAAAHQVKRGLIIGHRPTRERQAVAIRLVHGEPVGELENAALDPLQLVPAPGSRR